MSATKGLPFRLQQVKDLLLTKTVRNSGVLFGGNIITTLLTVVSTIFISRSLGPENYGILAVYSTVVATILGFTDFGLGTASIKLISSALETDRRFANVLMKVVFRLEMVAGLIVAAVGLLFSSQIARALGGDHLLFPVRMAFIAGVFSSAGAFIGPFLVAHEKFKQSALLGISVSLLKTFGVIGFAVFSILRLDNVLLLYVLINIAAFFIGLAIAPKGYRVQSSASENKRAYSKVLHFSKWILLAYFANVIASRIDVFLISRYRNAKEVGLYAAAQQLAQILPLLIGAITTALLPKIAKMKRVDEFKSYIKKVLFGTFCLVAALVPTIFLSSYVIDIIFGDKFSESTYAFQVLFVGYLVALVVNPLSLVFYAKDKPKVMTLLNYITLVFSITLNLVLIPMYGYVGAAYTFIAGNILIGLIFIPLLYREIRMEK